MIVNSLVKTENIYITIKGRTKGQQPADQPYPAPCVSDSSHQERDIRVGVFQVAPCPAFTGSLHPLGFLFLFSPAQSDQGRATFQSWLVCLSIPLQTNPACGVVSIMGKRLISFQFCNVGGLLKGLCAFGSHINLLPSTFQIPSAPKCGPFNLRGGEGWGGIISIVTFSNGARLT